MIQRLTVEVNGQTLVNLNNYNTLWHALLYMTATDDYLQQRRVAQSNCSAAHEDDNGDVFESAVSAEVRM